MTFGRNLHLARVNVATVYSEITGRPVGEVVERGDGSNDLTLRPETIRVKAEVFMDLNEFRRRLYHLHRELGVSDEEARYRLFPEGRITV